MDIVIYKNGTRYLEKHHSKESDIEQLVIDNHKTLFGKNSLYIDAKKKIDNSAFGGVIPDGFLFDLTDITNPEFYIVEVELSKHSFFNHIFPQITKFFAFFNNSKSQGMLIEKLYEIIDNDKELLTEIKYRIGKKEVFKFIKDSIESSQNILIIIDKEKPEFPEIIETYTDTWGKLVKVAILKKYISELDNSDSIITMSPNFENIENIDIVLTETDQSHKQNTYTEEFHLEGVPENIKNLFEKLKTELLTKIENLTFNPQRYYISLRKKRNFAFLKIRHKKISIVTLLEEEKLKEKIKNYEVVSLSKSVQNFYNGPCARIDLTNSKYLEEVINTLIEIQK